MRGWLAHLMGQVRRLACGAASLGPVVEVLSPSTANLCSSFHTM
jgi:hypothetical protein